MTMPWNSGANGPKKEMTSSERYGDIPEDLVSDVIYPIPHAVTMDDWLLVRMDSKLKEFAKNFQFPSDSSWDFLPVTENTVDFKYTTKDIELLLKRYESGIY